MNEIYKYIIILLLVSCSSQNREKDIIKIDVHKINEVKHSFESYKSLTLDNQVLIASIDKLKIVGDKLFILDKKNNIVNIYDLEGNLLNTINRYGQGPEEYTNIADIEVSDTCIYVLSHELRKLLVYNFDGHFVDNIQLDYNYINLSLLGKEDIVFYSSGSNNSMYNLRILSLKNKTLKGEFSPFKYSWSYSLNNNPFKQTISNDTILVSMSLDNNIYKLSDNSFTPVIELDFNTVDQIPSDIAEMNFDEVHNMIMTKSFVNSLNLVYNIGCKYYFLYILGGRHYMSTFNCESKSTTTCIMEYDEDGDFPFIFAHPLIIHNGYLISYLSADVILKFKKEFPSNKNNDKLLKEEDNPVLFFHKLK